MDLVYLLFANLIIVSMLVLFSIWVTNYNMAWWLRVKRSEYLMKNFFGKLVYLEIKLPRDVFKNPAAMEILFNSLYQTLGYKPNSPFRKRKVKDDGHGHKKKEPFWEWSRDVRTEFFLTYLSGSMRLWSSLEIASIEGQIKFFLCTPEKFAEIFKSHAYSQFPGIEINQVEDYLLNFDYNKKVGGKPNIYVGKYKLAKDDCLPIKTYVDYGLDKDPKEEYKIDPLLPLLEGMASAQPGESFFYQILIRPTVDEELWKNETKQRMDKILGITRVEKEAGKYNPEGAILKQEKQTVQLLPHEKTELEILERNIEKNGFDCIIRMFYHVQDAEKFHLNRGVFTVVNAMKSFGKPGFNEFKFDTITVDGDTPFLDPTGEYTEGKRKWTWFLFKLRTGFYHEGEGLEGDWATFKSIFRKWWVGKNTEWALSAWGELKEYYGMPGQFKHRHDGNVYIFNTEELATLWHFPGKAFGNTTGRVESVKSEPPTNLPL
jgi:hypothetical protein